ncbi:hypothetical protein KIH31_15290 [Paenarthrobacter sp. DKR-5]|uniref:hypothetical protein n=1 Tax=Paenarthrobacter sp. DKR-5 TaxID=2835535 RepID=UPI001BDC4F4A|nr:hypothetical protein [Paenarthrobacter sp. DKR-5]MBT1003954.1 hypothetical protein [Paenarthrobacter sp. DKR-5]
MDKDTRKLIRKLTRQGFDVRRTRGGHFAVRAAGVQVTVLAGTASDWRSTRNDLARLRRAGFTQSA